MTLVSTKAETKVMYAYRHQETKLWWNGLKAPDTDSLAEAALFATKIAGGKIAPQLRYDPVRIKVTLEEE